jgi:hypothetical protein
MISPVRRALPRRPGWPSRRASSPASPGQAEDWLPLPVTPGNLAPVLRVGAIKGLTGVAFIVILYHKNALPQGRRYFQTCHYFTKADRKKLFFDYLKLVGILEIVIFIVVVLWASDDKYHRVQSAFPWREYVFVAFAFPIVFTFYGVIITGFNCFSG